MHAHYKLALQDKWSELAAKRGYMAVVEGRVSAASGTVKSWLKQIKAMKVYSVSKGNDDDAKEAITHYKIAKVGNNFSLLEITLQTGRKNQIRVHMSDIGHPIAGDVKYGVVSNPLKRLCLHAHLLVIRHPYTNVEMRFESPMPSVFKKLFRNDEN